MAIYYMTFTENTISNFLLYMYTYKYQQGSKLLQT